MIFYDQHKSESYKHTTMSDIKSEKLVDSHQANDTFVEYEIDDNKDEERDIMPYDDDTESRVIESFEEGENYNL